MVEMHQCHACDGIASDSKPLLFHYGSDANCHGFLNLHEVPSFTLADMSIRECLFIGCEHCLHSDVLGVLVPSHPLHRIIPNNHIAPFWCVRVEVLVWKVRVLMGYNLPNLLLFQTSICPCAMLLFILCRLVLTVHRAASDSSRPVLV